MVKKEDTPAKRAVIRAWDAWAAKHPHEAATLAGGMVFFTYLQNEHPELLDFKSSPGEKWQAVHGWLLQERRVKEQSNRP